MKKRTTKNLKQQVETENQYTRENIKRRLEKLRKLGRQGISLSKFIHEDRQRH